MEDLGTHITIPLPLVSSNILKKFIQYSRHHALHAPHHVNNTWDLEFLQTLDDRETFLKLVLTAHYRCIKNLLDLTCQAIDDMIRGKTLEQICQILNIQNEDDSTSQQ
jgi:S-phase kinase-associated protein 1